MQQIIGHIWTNSHHWCLPCSFSLLGWTTLKSAEKHKTRGNKRKQLYIKHCSLTCEKSGGWNWYSSDYSDSVAVIQISLVACIQADRQWCTPTTIAVCRSQHTEKQHEAWGQRCHFRNLDSHTKWDGLWLQFEYKSNIPSTWDGLSWGTWI